MENINQVSLKARKIIFKPYYVTLVVCFAVLCFISLTLMSCGNNIGAPTYKIKFDSNGGSEVEEIISEAGVDIFAPEKPTKEGYKFMGWYLDGKKYDFTQMPKYNITLVAKWIDINSLDSGFYKVILNVNGGSDLDNLLVEIGNTAVLPTPSKPGYTFEGWYNGDEKVTEVYQETVEDINLEARWNKIEYKINYENTKDSENENSGSYNIESGSIILKDLVKPGYTFEGWYNGDEKVTEIPAGSTGNITIEAKWIKIEFTIIYRNIKDCVNPNVPSYNVENDKIVLKDLAKPGYTFEGWYNGDEKVTEISAGSTGNITIEAKWIKIEFTIIYQNLKGCEHQNATTYDVESDTFILNDIAKDGYTFEGWYNGDEKVTEIKNGSTGNLTLEAKWILITFDIIFTGIEGAENNNVLNYTVEDVIQLLNPTHPDKNFAGWYNGNEKVTEISLGSFGNLTLEAKWTVKVSGNIYKAGTDYDLSNSLLLIDVKIILISVDVYLETYSDANGNYVFDTVPTGEYTIKYVKEGYINIEFTIELTIHVVKHIYMDIVQESTVKGTIVEADTDTNISNNRALPGATVTLTKHSGTNVLELTTTTDDSGKYNFINLTAGIYLIAVSKEGYVPLEQYILVEERANVVQNMAVEVIEQADEDATGGASGIVYDASVQGNVGVPGLTLTLRAGINNITAGEILGTYTTGSNGTYQIDDLVPGNYTIVVTDEREGISDNARYTESYFNIKVIANVVIANQNGSVAPVVDINELRIVLEWGSYPSDLDSHITGPTSSGGRYHVYYNNMSSGNASLDRDDTTSYGPETITVSLNVDGVYRYSIHDYSNRSSYSSTGIQNSGATVKVYCGGKLLYTFYAPEGTGTLWTVFEYDTTTKTIIPIDKLSNQSTPSYVS